MKCLFLTPITVYLKIIFFRTNNIEVILNVASGIENKFEHIEYHNIELLDLPEQDIKSGKGSYYGIFCTNFDVLTHKYGYLMLLFQNTTQWSGTEGVDSTMWRFRRHV